MPDFFCDPSQLEYLVQHALPELIGNCGCGVKKRLVLWCVSCSGGEEAYTLAMVLKEFAGRYPGLPFEFLVLATDTSPVVLEAAERAIYHEASVSLVPMAFRRKYLLKSRDREKKLVKIAPELREFVKFRNVDLLAEDLKFRESIDIIFCRDLPGRVVEAACADLLGRFCRHLSPGGYLFLDRSEPPVGLNPSLVPAASGIYRKLGGGTV